LNQVLIIYSTCNISLLPNKASLLPYCYTAWLSYYLQVPLL